MKRTTVILIILLLVPLAFTGCKQPTETNTKPQPIATSPTTNEAIAANPKTEASDHSKQITTPEFLNDIGKTLNTLRKEHPEAIMLVQNGGLPDAAAICFGEPKSKYAYYFFGTQDGDAEKVMNGYDDQLKCAGFVTSADVLFPEMKADMPFSDFFSLIGVSDYSYNTDEDNNGQGWLDFKYKNMKVWLNTNEITTGGGWNFTGVEKVKENAPVAIFDEEIDSQNYELAQPVMYE